MDPPPPAGPHIEEIEFFTDSEVESLTASIVLHDALLRFSLYPVSVSQSHLTGRKTFMLIDENYIEFSTFLLLIRNYARMNGDIKLPLVVK